MIVGEGGPFANGQPAWMGEVRPMVVEPPTGSELTTTWLPCDGRRLSIRHERRALSSDGHEVRRRRDGRLRVPDSAAARRARGGGSPAMVSSRSTTCDAVTPAFPNIVPLDAFVGSIVHRAYTDDMAARACGVALCRGWEVLVDPRNGLDLAAVIGSRFGGERHQGLRWCCRRCRSSTPSRRPSW